MGGGGDNRPARDSFFKNPLPIDKIKSISDVKDDLIVLKSIWFNKAKGTDHAARLENFYGPQAHACESPRLRARSSVIVGSAADSCRAPAQTTSSGPTSCGGGSLCLPPARRASRAGAT